VPLDIFLLRSHALPLRFLSSPSLSFLIYIPTRAYLSLLHASTSFQPVQANPSFLPIDIPLPRLRQHLSTYPPFGGATIATLSLHPVPEKVSYSPSISISAFDSRPTFPLAPFGTEVDHIFPQIVDLGLSSINGVNAGEKHTWMLDFTQGGKCPGVVMSQSRMRDIELLINPFSAMDQMDTAGIMSFRNGSWVDLLVSNFRIRSIEGIYCIFVIDQLSTQAESHESRISRALHHSIRTSTTELITIQC
jgi:hypothetical protein